MKQFILSLLTIFVLTSITAISQAQAPPTGPGTYYVNGVPFVGPEPPGKYTRPDGWTVHVYRGTETHLDIGHQAALNIARSGADADEASVLWGAWDNLKCFFDWQGMPDYDDVPWNTPYWCHKTAAYSFAPWIFGEGHNILARVETVTDLTIPGGQPSFFASVTWERYWYLPPNIAAGEEPEQ